MNHLLTSSRISMTRMAAAGALRLCVLLVALACASALAQQAASVATEVHAGEDHALLFLADQMLDSLEGRDWLLTDGFADDALRARAKERGIALNVVSLAATAEGGGDWRKAANDVGVEAIRPAIEFGPVVFLRHWMRADPDGAAKRIALGSFSDLWRAEGFATLPNKLVFLGHRDEATLKARLEGVLDEHREFWDDVGEQLASGSVSSVRTADARLRLRRQCGLVANNLGVALERVGLRELAFECYARSRVLDPQNVSALLNRAMSVKQGVRPELAEQVGRELQGLRENLPDMRLLWSLAPNFGLVVAPGDFVGIGWPWALSGLGVDQDELLATELRRVENAEQREALRRQLEASRNLQLGGSAAGMKLVDALGDSEKRGDALLVQLALAVAQGKLDEAEDLLGKAAEAGVPPARLISERAGILAARQKVPEAIAALEAGVKEHPEAWFLWARLTLLQYESKDEASLAKTVRQFAAVPGAEPFNLHVAKGRLAALQGNAWAARDSYLQALQVNDKAVFLYDLILPLDFALADKRGAEEHATALLKLAPGHNFANYIMGSLLLERKEYGLAEAHLRRSIGSGPTMHALNDYAVLLLETKRPKEAEHVARAALEMDAGSAAVLDTLGSTLTAQERYDEAFEYIKKSIEAGGDADVRIVLHWAEALARRGDVEEAKAAAAKAAAGRAQFTAEESDRLRKLQAKLGAGN